MNNGQFAKNFPANVYKCSDTTEDLPSTKIFLAIFFVSSKSPKF